MVFIAWRHGIMHVVIFMALFEYNNVGLNRMYYLISSYFELRHNRLLCRDLYYLLYLLYQPFSACQAHQHNPAVYLTHNGNGICGKLFKRDLTLNQTQTPILSIQTSSHAINSYLQTYFYFKPDLLQPPFPACHLQSPFSPFS